MAETRYLVVCCDGTWNRADQRSAGVPCPTNVRLIHNALQPTENQLVQYFSGVGTDGGLLRRVVRGGVGLGLSRNIMNAYLWLADIFQPGDRIVLFGFSRGAYTVRSLVGMLTRCGLVSFPDGTRMQERLRVVQRIYNREYQKGEKVRTRSTVGTRSTVRPRSTVTFHFGPGDEAPIAFLGVWDTVGALGVPRSLGLLGLLFQRKRYQFHDVDIHQNVAHARQALALDERRGPFVPSVWRVPENMRDRVKQLWFPGVHSDVGGGYLQTGLSHGTLAWMIEEVKRVRVPLQWQTKALVGIKGDPFDVLHDSCTGMYQYLAPRPRNTPPVVEGSPEVHASAVDRSNNPPLADIVYRQTTIVRPNDSYTVPVYAHLPWNATGLYLEPGEYRFSATGEWLDREIAAGPEGVRGIRTWVRGMIGYGLGTLAGVIRRAIQVLTNNQAANVPGSKRVLRAKWMELVCVVVDDEIGNDDNRVTNSDPIPHRRFPETITVKKPGYLYAFANDAWITYGKNRGSVRLTIKRQS